MSFPRHALALFALAAILSAHLFAGSVIQLPAPSSDSNPIGTVYSTTPLTAGPTFPAWTDNLAIFTRPTLVAADTTYWIVSKSGTNILRVLNKDFQPVTEKNLGTSAVAAAMSPDGKRFLIIAGNILRIFDAATIQEIPIVGGTLDVGISPTDIVVSHDSKRAFVFSGLGQKVTAVDLSNNTVIGSVGPFIGINSGYISMGPNGMLYVSAPLNATSIVHEINPTATPFDMANARTRQFNLTGKVGRLHFTPDGTRALAVNENPATGAVLYYLNLAAGAGGLATIPNTDPAIGNVIFDKIYVLGNNQAYGVSSTNSSPSRRLFRITLPDLPAPGVNLQSPTAVEAAFGGLDPIPIVEGITYSREYPQAKQLFVSAPLSTISSIAQSVLYQFDIPGNNNKVSEINLPYTPGLAQYVDPVQSSNTATVGQVITYNNNTSAIPVNSKALPIGVKVMTANGEPIYGLPVVFNANVAGVTFDGGNTVTTNKEGYAFVVLNTPATQGTFSVTAAPSGSSFVVGFTLVSGAPTNPGGPGNPGNPGSGSIEVISGSGLIMISGNQAPSKTVVQVLDASGKPIPNVEVLWRVTSGSGYFIEGSSPGDGSFDRTTITDAAGKTENQFQSQSFIASLGSISNQSTASASTLSGNAEIYMTTIAFNDSNGAPVGNPSTQFRLNGLTFDQDQPEPLLLSGKIGETLAQGVTARFSYPLAQGPIQNAAIELVNNQDPATGPAARCVPKATPHSGVDGVAVCDVQFYGKAGVGSITLKMGGIGEKSINLRVTPGDANTLVTVQGNGQSVKPGEIAPATFQARVTDNAGNPLQGFLVRWQVVGGSATFGTTGNTQTEGTSNAQGLVSVTVKAGNTPGQVTIRASIVASAAPTAIVNFTMNVVQTATQLRKPTTGSGDNQNAFVNANFPAALVVEVLDATNTPVQGATVDFSIVSGTATLTSAASAQTSASGRAQVTVRAGANAGPISIRAAVANLTPVTFTLNVNLPGPLITANSFRNAASGEFGSVTPGGLVTITGEGVAPGVTGVIFGSSLLGAWPTRLNGVEVQFGNTLAPIYRVANLDGVQSVTVQAPFDLSPGFPVSVILRSGGGSTTVNNIPVVDFQPGIFETIDQSNRRYAVAVRPNGTYVTPENPARTGEVIRIFVNGLGQTTPPIIAGQTGSGQTVAGEVVVGLNDAGVRVVSAVYAPNLVGIYEVAFEVPAITQTGISRPLAVVVVRPNGQFVYGNGSTLPVSQ